MHSGVIAGLVPAIQLSARSPDHSRANTGQRVKEIVPVRILGLLALDGLSNVAVFLEPNEQRETVFSREARCLAFAVLLDAADDAVGDTDVECASRLARQYVDP